MAELIDLSAVPDSTACDCLESLFKALSEPPRDDEALIWAHHDDPYLRWHLEDVSGRLQAILVELQDAFARALTGEPIGDLAKALAPWLRWSDTEMQAVRERLESKPPARYDLDDWMLLVDMLIQRYLPNGVISREAEYATVRAAVLGKMEAYMAGRANAPPEAVIEMLHEAIPTELRALPKRTLGRIETMILRISKQRAALHISNLAESARSRMKEIIIQHVQAQIGYQKEGGTSYLQTRIHDEFATLNRDCRRIAVTETGECLVMGMVAAQRPGTRVKRHEAYKGACSWCKSIDGKVFTVVAEDAPVKDGETEIWVGKTNVGRSASPRMRQGGHLVERPSAEMWWPAAGLQHPHCRGGYIPVLGEKPPAVSQEFEDFADALIAKARAGVASRKR